jgi:hypothetical protein
MEKMAGASAAALGAWEKMAGAREKVIFSAESEV